MTIPIRRAVARLMRVSEATSNRHWYVPRDVLTDKPFFPATEGSYVDVLQLDSAAAWSQADARYIRRLIRERFNQPG